MADRLAKLGSRLRAVYPYHEVGATRGIINKIIQKWVDKRPSDRWCNYPRASQSKLALEDNPNPR